MPDVSNCKHISDDAVIVAVNLFAMLLQIILCHFSLQFCTLVGIESYIIGLVIEVQRLHVQLASCAVGWLFIKPCERLILIGNFSSGCRSRRLPLGSALRNFPCLFCVCGRRAPTSHHTGR